MGAPEVPTEAAGVNRQHAAWYQREREREHAMLELLRLYLHTIDLIQKKLYEGLHLTT